jgi:hypothetical protein
MDWLPWVGTHGYTMSPLRGWGGWEVEGLGLRVESEEQDIPTRAQLRFGLGDAGTMWRSWLGRGNLGDAFPGWRFRSQDSRNLTLGYGV